MCFKVILKKLLITFTIVLIFSSCKTSDLSNNSYNYLTNKYPLLDTLNLKNDAKVYFINASNYQIQGKYAESILEFQDAARLDSNPGIFYSMAKSYVAIAKNERAIENLKTSLLIDPNYLPSLDLLIEIYYLDFSIDKAIEINIQALKIDNSKERKVKQAMLYEMINPIEAIKIYESLNNEEENYFIIGRLATLYAAKNNKEKHIEYLLKAYKLEPTSLMNAYEILKFYYSNNDLNAALEFINQNRSNFSQTELIKLYKDLGSSLYGIEIAGKKELINEYLKELDNKYYFEPDLMILGAYLSYRISDTTKIDYFLANTYKSVDSMSTFIIASLDIYNSTKQFQKSILLINNNIELIEKDENLLYLAGISYSFANLDSLAEQTLVKCLKFNKHNADIFTQLGYVYDKMGKINLSDSSYLMALDIDPLNALANNNYAYTLAERGLNLREALLMSQTAVEKEPESSAYWDTYGWIYYRMGNPENAEKYIKKSIELGESSGEVYEHLGIVLLELKKNDEAMKAFEKALDIEPDRKISKRNLEILKNN